jgi:hypothetical protein
MIVLDENVPESQRALLRSSRVALRQVGHDIALKGMKDDQIISLLHRLDRPTFFSLDGDFYERRLCHKRYCLVHLDIDDEQTADYVRRLLRHHELNTKAKRLGRVIRVLPTGLTFWRVHQEHEGQLPWR